MLALTVNVACAEEPDVARVAVPSVTVPSEKFTVPEAEADPLAGLTVASRTVLPVVSRLAGAAVKLTAVEMAGDATLIDTEAVELEKLPVPV